MHKPIQLIDLSLYWPNKICFEHFTASIHYGDRIAIIGRNGCGKSSLLKLLQGLIAPTYGKINLPSEVQFGYLRQIIVTEDSNQSGAEQLNSELTQALCLNPNVLLLDEPTNHLDKKNRRSLLRMLDHFPGTLIIASHDVTLLKSSIHHFWHIDAGKIHTFQGEYVDYQQTIAVKREQLNKQLTTLQQQKSDMHAQLMKAQQRAAKSRTKGKKSIAQRKWPTVVSNAKADRAETHAGSTRAAISAKKQVLLQQLSQLNCPEIITPTFSLDTANYHQHLGIAISLGSISYNENSLLDKIHLSLPPGSRIAIAGDNGCGKTTLMKAIMADPNINTTGHWSLPPANCIGYLDQHYKLVNPTQSVIDNLANVKPDWSEAQIRRHLSDFLFYSNEEIYAQAETLSGGEKARLALAKIAANSPGILLLDEVSNNLDLEARDHMIQVLNAYPGTLIIISHDQDFLNAINLDETYTIKKGLLLNTTQDQANN